MKEGIIVVIECKTFIKGAVASILDTDPVEIILGSKVLSKKEEVEELKETLKDYENVKYYFSFLGNTESSAQDFIQEFYKELLESNENIKIIEGEFKCQHQLD